MRVVRIKTEKREYCCNVFLVLGERNLEENVNTLVDVGSRGNASDVIGRIGKVSTGIGKNPVEQVVLTHGHSDHAGGLRAIRERFNPVVRAFDGLAGVDRLLTNGQVLRMGDRLFEVMHTPGHSADSVCLYCAEEKVLFSGDTPLRVRVPGGLYATELIEFLGEIGKREIDVIYSGHSDPVTSGALEMVRTTLINMKKSRVVAAGGKR